MYIFHDEVSRYCEIHFHVKFNYIRTKFSPHRNPWYGRLVLRAILLIWHAMLVRTMLTWPHLIHIWSKIGIPLILLLRVHWPLHSAVLRWHSAMLRSHTAMLRCWLLVRHVMLEKELVLLKFMMARFYLSNTDLQVHK